MWVLDSCVISSPAVCYGRNRVLLVNVGMHDNNLLLHPFPALCIAELHNELSSNEYMMIVHYGTITKVSATTHLFRGDLPPVVGRSARLSTIVIIGQPVSIHSIRATWLPLMYRCFQRPVCARYWGLFQVCRIAVNGRALWIFSYVTISR
jgi:hypothetical protein